MVFFMRTSDLVARLQSLGGCARSATLFALGATKNDLRTAVRGGHIAMLRRGVYAAPGTPPAVCEAARHGGALTCGRALRAHGIWVLEGEGPPHVWLGAHGRAHPHTACRCVGHWSEGTSSLGVLDPAPALLHYARCSNEEGFFAALESALRIGAIGSSERAWIRERLPERLRWLVDLAHSKSDSGLESIVRLRLHRIGITVEAQVTIIGVGTVDFVIDGVVILEVDGVENHDGPSKRHKDLVRDAEANARGYTPLRFDYALVIHNWPRVERAIIGALRARGRRMG